MNWIVFRFECRHTLAELWFRRTRVYECMWVWAKGSENKSRWLNLSGGLEERKDRQEKKKKHCSCGTQSWNERHQKGVEGDLESNPQINEYSGEKSAWGSNGRANSSWNTVAQIRACLYAFPHPSTWWQACSDWPTSYVFPPAYRSGLGKLLNVLLILPYKQM